MDAVYKLVKKHRTNDPYVIATNMNISIRYADLGEHTRGIYHRTLGRRFIVIHNNLSSEWQRFICAHELGHDRLHKGINRFFVDAHSFHSAGKFERQANVFAIQLLTALDAVSPGESVYDFMQRSGVPAELHKFYR